MSNQSETGEHVGGIKAVGEICDLVESVVSCFIIIFLIHFILLFMQARAMENTAVPKSISTTGASQVLILTKDELLSFLSSSALETVSLF